MLGFAKWLKIISLGGVIALALATVVPQLHIILMVTYFVALIYEICERFI